MAHRNPHRDEIRAILLGSPSHYANALRDLEAGWSVERSAKERDVSPERIVYLRETVRMTLEGELSTNKRRAANQAGVYQDLLNYAMSKELRQHVDSQFARLAQIARDVKKEPLRYTKLGANDRPRPTTPHEPCASCNTVHRGECW